MATIRATAPAGISQAGLAPWAAAIDQRYFTLLCMSLVGANIATFLYHLSGSSIFNISGNAISMVLIAYSFVTVFRSPGDTTSLYFLFAAMTMVGVSLIVNLDVASISDALKYLSIYAFFAAGRACGGQLRPVELRCLCILAALPIIFLGVGTSKVFADGNFFASNFAYLPNENTATLYFSSLLFATAPRFGNRVILLQFLNALLMNRVGALLSTAGAVALWIVFPFRRESVLTLVAAVVAVLAAFELGALARPIASLDNMMLVLNVQPGDVAKMSYKELVQLTGSTDLSGFFRLIHWSNILDIYTSGSVGTLLFGYGPGQTAALTYAGLVPHNDYLRIVAEYGPFNLIIFVGFLLHVKRGLTTAATTVLFVVLCIYFVSENLLDNFTSMALYFAYAGRFATTPIPD